MAKRETSPDNLDKMSDEEQEALDRESVAHLDKAETTGDEAAIAEAVLRKKAIAAQSIDGTTRRWEQPEGEPNTQSSASSSTLTKLRAVASIVVMLPTRPPWTLTTAIPARSLGPLRECSPTRTNAYRPSYPNAM